MSTEQTRDLAAEQAANEPAERERQLKQQVEWLCKELAKYILCPINANDALVIWSEYDSIAQEVCGRDHDCCDFTVGADCWKRVAEKMGGKSDA